MENLDNIEQALFETKINALEPDKNSKIILFGGGLNGRMSLDYLTEIGLDVHAFCDNNTALHGSVIAGIPCISPDDLQNLSDAIVFITAKHVAIQIKKQLSDMGIQSFVFDHFVLSRNLNHIRDIYSYMYDELSRKTYLILLEAAIKGDACGLKNVWEPDEYFSMAEFSTFNRDEVFVDCGAFVGDTLEKYLLHYNGIFKKYYAFEPGRRQFEALKHRVKRLEKEWALDSGSIVCEPAGVGEKETFGHIDSTSYALTDTRLISDKEKTRDSINIYSIDQYFKDGKDEIVSFIKSDIEGYEMRMLRGAQHTIMKNKPKLAVAIYHKPQDHFEIPQYIKSLVPEYKMAIRQHAVSLMNTVLYCWI